MNIKALEGRYWRIEYPKVLKKLEQLKKENYVKYKKKRIKHLKSTVQLYEFFLKHVNSIVVDKNLTYLEKKLEIELYGKYRKKLKMFKNEIKRLKGNVSKKGLTELQIQNARNYPISNLVEFNRANKSKCVFHEDKNPSMHYYKDSNSVYCFSCHKSGDAIEVTRALCNLNFKEAVSRLSGSVQ